MPPACCLALPALQLLSARHLSNLVSDVSRPMLRCYGIGKWCGVIVDPTLQSITTTRIPSPRRKPFLPSQLIAVAPLTRYAT